MPPKLSRFVSSAALIVVGAVHAVVLMVAVFSNGNGAAEPAGAQSPTVDEAFCANLSLGGPITYPFDSDGDGAADVCALPYTRREAVARQSAYEKLAEAHPHDWAAAMATACREIGGRDFGDSDEALAGDSCSLGVPVPPSNWTVYEGPARSHPHLDRPYYRGVWAAADGSGARLFVVCSHDDEDDPSGGAHRLRGVGAVRVGQRRALRPDPGLRR